MDDLEKRTQEYYDRKMRHREEMLPYLAWILLIGMVIFIIAILRNALGSW